MTNSVIIPGDCEGILIFSYMEDRWFTLYQLDADRFEIHRSSFSLAVGANFICLCGLRDKCCALKWEDEPKNHIRYKVIPSKYPKLYVLVPKGAPKLDEYRQKVRVVLKDTRNDLPWPEVCYDPPNMLELCATHLLINGIGRKEVAVVQPGLVWAMFEAATLSVKMRNPENREYTPMCPFSYHTWEKYVTDN